MQDRFTVLSKASIRPNKIVFYQQFISNVTQKPVQVQVMPEPKNLDENCQIDVFAPLLREAFEKKIAQVDCAIVPSKAVTLCNQHNFELSKKAAGRIKEKISWLYELAKIKTVVPSKGKPLYSFKMNFITLTLPALQAHATAEISSQCLNQFLTECKQKFKLANYVWRLEFQANGNAHYHIATDTYIDYTSCKLIWNRCLFKLGYISAYQEKFRGMSFETYRNLYSNGDKVAFNVLRERYGRGRASNWDSPNTVDVRTVGNAKNIAFYISKYITKKSDIALNPVVAAREPDSTNLRLWFCSKSLSALDKIEIFMDSYSDLVHDCLSGLQDVRRYVYDYCTVLYFNGKEQIGKTKRDLWQLYRQYATSRGYIPAG